MFVLGIQGSPRKNGNSEYLLSSFLKECEQFGASTRIIQTRDLSVHPCRELIVCEKKGFCPIKDEMESKGYALLKQADVIVLASPVFFYNVSAQAKIFIDRCQMFWGRKYKLRLKDPDRFSRQGFLLSVAASGGKRLFEGVELTAKYFFDALSADYTGSLTYKKVEDAGEIIVRPELEQEIRDAVSHLLTPEQEKKRLIFISQNGQCRSLIATAFAKEKTRGQVRVVAAGLTSGNDVQPDLVKAMESMGLDIKYWRSLALDMALKETQKLRDKLVFLGTAQDFEGLGTLKENCELWEVTLPDLEDQTSLKTAIEKIRNRVDSLAGF